MWGWGAEGVEEGRMAGNILISPLDLISKPSTYEIKIASKFYQMIKIFCQK